ncbi:CRISPR-associated Cse2 family protein [Geothermobacter ehrlichii]|uniref:CRISPR-associated Cse2 family protein n=1 Tax=Geothermobacter ehrlichii TaxID=213224 RepID=A0A5D3WIB1_9BACT|nr:type I-E CRISPR-associated protein Cse2/CasB [Geothermobacter ehrlichii]TYO97623.1 CRISPR-associated Cse2 family protein [Geothermobacter ehrlichii]
MSAFFEWLEDLNARDRKVRAVLRRSLAYEPGAFPPAYPYVEPFLPDESSEWRRGMHYLAAGLWALHWREGRQGQPMSLGRACAAYQSANGSLSTEQRFVALLDADRDQLLHRLRQMVALLKDYPLDFGSLLSDLLAWNNPRKPVQNRWARDYYRSAATNTTIESNTQEENVQ